MPLKADTRETEIYNVNIDFGILDCKELTRLRVEMKCKILK
jgi:hypothetical protein